MVEIINELTKLPKEYIINNIIFKNSKLPVKYLEEKQKITDLVVEIENTVINIEMNNFYYKGLIERNDIYLNELRKVAADDEIMKKVEEKITMLSEDATMILCYDEEEYKEKVRQAVIETEK